MKVYLGKKKASVESYLGDLSLSVNEVKQLI